MVGFFFSCCLALPASPTSLRGSVLFSPGGMHISPVVACGLFFALLALGLEAKPAPPHTLQKVRSDDNNSSRRVGGRAVGVPLGGKEAPDLISRLGQGR